MGSRSDPGPFSSLEDALVRWAADRREEEGVAARIRTQRLRTRSDEESTLAEVLLDLAGRDRRVAVDTAGGRTRRGRLLAVGSDFLAIGRESHDLILVALSAVAAVRADPGPGLGGGRGGPVDPGRASLAGILSRVAGERRRVSLVAGGVTVVGELSSVGADIVVVEPDGPATGATVVQLRLIDEVSLLGSG